jgi:N-acyl-D-aspartate/D-glutamate deacylase
MATYDLVIRHGTIVDGTGREPFAGDLAVADGRIAAVGAVSGAGREEIDARDRLVTPGFVDIHTHFDGQITWDDSLAPSSGHGVTTAVMGNCGVGFAPCRPEQREMLVKLMEGVEDIPGIVLAEGVPFAWESFGEYLEFIGRRRTDMDFAAQVPHAPVRVYVMGERGANREPATAADAEQMAQIVADGLRAGALGFSTSRTMNHRTRDGSLIATITAGEPELAAIARAMASVGTGVLQVLDDFSDASDAPSLEFEMWRRMLQMSGRPLSFSVTQREGLPDRWRQLLAYIDSANAQGFTVRGQVLPRPIGLLFGLDASVHPFASSPTYQRIADRPLAERVAEMRKPEVRRQILAEESKPAAHISARAQVVGRMYPLGDPPNYSPDPQSRIDRRAAALGVDPNELAYDLLLERDGRALLYYPSNNFHDGNLDVVLKMMRSKHTLIGLSDGGAHVGCICDSSAPTYLLAYWTRDRDGERLSVPQAIKMLAADTAAFIGLADRGVLRPGYKADVNVIDYDGLTLHAPLASYDLPAGGRRLMQKADGYVATVVSGEVTYRDGAATGAKPGRLVRGAKTAPP